jgi:two-component system cell cycle sensor histidine kinase/response regulator CckA
MSEIPVRERQSLEHVAARSGLSIQLRLLFLVMAAALPALLFSFFQARSASRVERANAEQRALQLARRIATRVDDHVNSVDALLLGLSRTVRADRSSRAHNEAVLVAVSRDLGTRFLRLSVADASGWIVGLSDPAASYTNISVADRRYFTEAMRTRHLGIGEPMIGRISHEYTLTLARSLPGARGEPVGIVAASTMLRQLRALLIPADLPDETVVTLVDSTGVVLARTKDAERWLGRNISGLGSVRHNLALREGVSESAGVDGIVRLSGFASATRVPWTVWVGIPSDVALERVHAQEAQALWLFACSLTVSLLLAWLLARGIAEPVRALTADAEAFASGDLSHRSRVTANGELGTLAMTFNRMADALERRGAELQASELRYRALFDMLPLPMWVYDVETLRFLEVNDAAVGRYGYSRTEFLGMTILDIRPAEDAEAFMERGVPADLVRTSGVPWRHRTRAGELLDVEINSDDLLYGVSRARLVVSIDVTERRRTELALRESQEQLRQSQKMEAVGSLAGGIAHDFNNLLTAILGYCDLALDAMPAGSAAGDDVAEIRRAALRAADLTHQLLAFSRRQVLKPIVFPLGPAAQQAERILRRLISENILLTLAVDAETPDVCADPTQLEQVILNLAVNARDAMPRGGRLLVRTGVRHLAAPRTMSGTTLAPGTYATLEVTDSGTGIAPEVRDRLFEPFFTTKARGQGTGLGLATVYGIVQQSGGAIEVVSETGRGSTFTLYFPVAPSSPEDAANAAAASSSPARLAARSSVRATILVAEDDDAVRAIACETLARAGYDVLSAANGVAALAVASAHAAPIDLLLTDVIMPGMNGRELADALSERRPGLRVLFASGYSDNVLLDQGALAPGVTLLDKPFTPAALAAKVADVLAGPAPELADVAGGAPEHLDG